MPTSETLRSIAQAKHAAWLRRQRAELAAQEAEHV